MCDCCNTTRPMQVRMLRTLIMLSLLQGHVLAFNPPLAPARPHMISTGTCKSHQKASCATSFPARAQSPTLHAAAPPQIARPPGGAPLTAFLVAIWYASSVICNQTSKRLLGSMGSQTLTLSHHFCWLRRPRPRCLTCELPSMESRRAHSFSTAVLAAAFTGGFVTSTRASLLCTSRL